MSFQTRVIVSDAVDGRVYYDYAATSTGDYRSIPGLVRKVTDHTLEQLESYGAYAIVNDGFAKLLDTGNSVASKEDRP